MNTQQNEKEFYEMLETEEYKKILKEINRKVFHSEDHEKKMREAFIEYNIPNSYFHTFLQIFKSEEFLEFINIQKLSDEYKKEIYEESKKIKIKKEEIDGGNFYSVYRDGELLYETFRE